MSSRITKMIISLRLVMAFQQIIYQLKAYISESFYFESLPHDTSIITMNDESLKKKLKSIFSLLFSDLRFLI